MSCMFDIISVAIVGFNSIFYLILYVATYRYTSRAMMIPFMLPTVGPTNQQEAESFKVLSEKIAKISSAVGWANKLGQDLNDGRQFDDDRLERVRSKLSGVEPRLCTVYTTLLFVVKKVCLYFYMIHIKCRY